MLAAYSGRKITVKVNLFFSMFLWYHPLSASALVAQTIVINEVVKIRRTPVKIEWVLLSVSLARFSELFTCKNFHIDVSNKYPR